MSPAAVLLLALLLQAEPPLEVPQLGLLEVRSLPATEVVWEGVALGRTDGDGLLEIAAVPPGTYAVELRKDGHVAARAEVEVSASERTFLRLPLAAAEPSGPPPTGDAAPLPQQASPPADASGNGSEVDTAVVLVASLAVVLVLASWRLARRRPRVALPPAGLALDAAALDDAELDDAELDDEGGHADFLTELRRRERVLDPSRDDDVLDADVIAEEIS